MKRPLHVLHVVEEFPPRDRLLGGVRVSIRHQIEGIAARHRVTVLAPRLVHPPLGRYRHAIAAPPSADPEAEALGIRILRPRYLHVPLAWPITQPLQLFAIAGWARAHGAGDVDVVHGHRAYPMGLAAHFFGRRFGVPVVVTGHGSDVHTDAVRGDPRSRYWTRWALRHADRVIVVSRRLEEIAQRIGVSADRLRYVPNGVDMDRFRPADRTAARDALRLPTDRPVFLCLSQFVPVKGVDVLLEAIRLAGTELDDAIFVLAGDGPQRASLEATSAAFGDRVRFAGRVDYADVSRWLAAADALVLPSRDEGTPLAALEALSAGRPVVGTAVGGTAEVIESGTCGLLVPPEDPAGLARVLAEALTRSWPEETLRRRAERFEWPRIVSEIETVYREAILAAAHRSASR